MRGVGLMGLATGSQAILQIVFLSVLAHLIEPKDFGLASGALIAVFFTTILAESGIGAALVQRKDLTPLHVRVGWTLSASLGLLCCALLVVLAPLLEQFLRLPGLTPIVRVIALIFVLNNLTLSDYLLARRLQFRQLGLAEFVSYAVGYGVIAIFLAVRGAGPWAIVGGQLGHSAMRTVLVSCLAPHSFRPAFARGPARDLLSYGGGHTIARVGNWASSQADNLIVGRYLGAAALGLYGRAYSLVQLPANLFGQVCNEVLFPAMAAVQNDKETLRRIFRLGLSALAMLALPLSIIAVITSEQLVLLLLGRDWLPLRGAFDVLAFGMMFRTNFKLSDSLARATGAVYRRAWRQVTFALMVIIGALAGKHWGIHGVSIGVLLALMGNYLLMGHLSIRIVGMSWWEFLVAHLPAVLMSLIAGGTALGVQTGLGVLNVHGIGQFAITWAAAALAIALVARLAPGVPGIRSIGELFSAVTGLFSGKPAHLLRRVLGPRYAIEATPGLAPNAPS